MHSCKIAADSFPSVIVQLWVGCGREAGYIPVVPHVRKRLRVSDVIGVVEREKHPQSEYLDLMRKRRRTD